MSGGRLVKLGGGKRAMTCRSAFIMILDFVIMSLLEFADN